jgi:hypothetical protein
MSSMQAEPCNRPLRKRRSSARFWRQFHWRSMSKPSLSSKLRLWIWASCCCCSKASATVACVPHSAQRRLVERFEAAAARPLALAEGPVVEAHQQFLNGLVDFGQAEELSLSQSRQDPPLDYQHTRFHLGLVAGFRAPRRHHRNTVVRGHFLIRPIDTRLIATSFGDARLQVIGDDDLGHAPRNSKVRMWAPIQSDSLCVPVASE